MAFGPNIKKALDKTKVSIKRAEFNSLVEDIMNSVVGKPSRRPMRKRRGPTRKRMGQKRPKMRR